MSKSDVKHNEIDYLFSGDLLNQCISSSFGLKETNIPYFGLYGACSTMVESMSLASILIDGGYADKIIAATSSHFCSAEKQFRFPLELRKSTSTFSTMDSYRKWCMFIII